jgi:hypothetical protein
MMALAGRLVQESDQSTSKSFIGQQSLRQHSELGSPVLEKRVLGN